ncbi:MAG: 50S ribosomal protein L3 [Planctomycetota bacterium]|nr:50S ribosomal protein L3 [Planctomycetota bacterium]
MTLILGRKQGMTQIFTEDGLHLGVTVVSAGPCVVTKVCTQAEDGYASVQLGYEDVPDRRVNKPQRGSFQKIGITPKRFLCEERLNGKPERAVGDTVTVEEFSEGDYVDVIGTTKGCGFAGTIKRHGFSRGPATHGGMNYRRPGSIGASAYPARVFKGKRMAGHLGNKRHTVKNLQVVRVDAERNLLFLKGAVPGPKGGFVQVQTAKTAAMSASKK